MRRLLLIPILLLGLATAGAFASSKRETVSTTGPITALGTSSIKVGARLHHRLTCAVTSVSPDLTSFQLGDRVRITCANDVLVAITSVPRPTHHSVNDEPVTAGISGRVTALSTTSITVHDGDRDLTCTLGSTSPSLTGRNVGDHVKIGCADGVLVSIAAVVIGPVTTNDTTTASYTNANGPIGALSATSITVQGMTCTIGTGSPSTSGFKTGDSVRMYCLNGALFQLRHNDGDGLTTTTTGATTTAPAGTTIANITGATGTITALTPTSITVHNSEHDLACTIGPSSPSQAGFNLGDLVRMYCASGVLFQLKHNDDSAPPTTTTTTTASTTTSTVTGTTTTTSSGTYTGANGTISNLTGASITVHTNDNSLTCTIGPGSPGTDGFQVGSAVKMYCLNGALYALLHQ